MQFFSLYTILAFVSGASLAIQIGMNASLSKGLQNPIMAALSSFLIGTMALVIYILTTKQTMPSTHSLQQLPSWVWMGGLLGALYVTLTIIAAPKIGAAQLVAFVVTGQMLASLILDHYGLVGFEVNTLNAWRILGAVFLIIGVILIRKF